MGNLAGLWPPVRTPLLPLVEYLRASLYDFCAFLPTLLGGRTSSLSSTEPVLPARASRYNFFLLQDAPRPRRGLFSGVFFGRLRCLLSFSPPSDRLRLRKTLLFFGFRFWLDLSSLAFGLQGPCFFTCCFTTLSARLAHAYVHRFVRPADVLRSPLTLLRSMQCLLSALVLQNPSHPYRACLFSSSIGFNRRPNSSPLGCSF